jgi:hypothetical protein
MTQQLPDHFDILAISLEDRRKRVAKSVPRQLLVDPQLLSHGLDVVAHNSAQPNRLLAALSSGPLGIGCPDIIGRFLVWGHFVPSQQIPGHIFVDGH